MTTAHDVLSGVIAECSHYISSAPLTGLHSQKPGPFRRHDPKEHNTRTLSEMAGDDSVRMFEWGIPIKTGEPMTGAAKKIAEYTIPLFISYPNTGDWVTFHEQDFETVMKACDPLSNPYMTTGCMLRMMDATAEIVEQKERGAFLVSAKLRVIAEIDT